MSSRSWETVPFIIRERRKIIANMTQPCEQEERRRLIEDTDRLEAAYNREDHCTILNDEDDGHRLPPHCVRGFGHAGQLRKAVEALVAYWDKGKPSPKKETELKEMCRAALKEPPRNCDVYWSPYDAADAWEEKELCALRKSTVPPCSTCLYPKDRCIARWLLATADQEGGRP